LYFLYEKKILNLCRGGKFFEFRSNSRGHNFRFCASLKKFLFLKTAKTAFNGYFPRKSPVPDLFVNSEIISSSLISRDLSEESLCRGKNNFIA